jgi:hypothetical protein
MHFTPTGATWLNLVKRWSREPTQKRLKRGTFRSVRDLIVGFVEEHNNRTDGYRWRPGLSLIRPQRREALHEVFGRPPVYGTDDA